MAEFDIIILGAGAAGYFGAIRAAERNPALRVLILEKTGKTLSKVRISGGGRCNVTHRPMDARELVKHYPRGERELLGPFRKWASAEMMEWVQSNGAVLKTEEDGRVFPATDDSTTITHLFESRAEALGIKLRLHSAIENIQSTGAGFLLTGNFGELTCGKLLMASGSSASAWELAASLGHTIVAPVPSLFAFDLENHPLMGLAGISVPEAGVSIPALKQEARGPLLITHKGISGPGVLRLSARCARELASLSYRAEIRLDWLPGISREELESDLRQLRQSKGGSLVENVWAMPLPARLKQWLMDAAGVAGKRVGDLTKTDVAALMAALKACTLRMSGKSTHKEEFVTAGGVALSEVDFRTMESKLVPGLHFAGEVLDIDAITGGFNFQAAWTTAELAAMEMGH